MNVELVWDLREEQCFAAYESLWGSLKEVWELLREVMWYEGCSERVVWELLREEMVKLLLEFRETQARGETRQIGQDMTRLDWWEMTRPVWPPSKSSI